MHTTRLSLIAFCLLMLWTATDAQVSATQTVTLEVRPVSKLAVTGNPGTLKVETADAGSELVPAVDNSSAYSLTTNVDNMKVAVSLDQPMPTGTKLLISLGSSRGVTLGNIDVSNALSPVDVVTGIGRGRDDNQTITYTFEATTTAGEIVGTSRTVVLTLTN